MDTDTTREIVGRLYDAVGRGDVKSYADLIHDDIDWIIYGPIEVFPFQGPRQGKAAVLDVMAEIDKHYELKRYTPEVIVADGDRAACLANVAFVQRATGRTLTFKLADFLRFESNLLIEFRELSDTFDVTQQALGRRAETLAECALRAGNYFSALICAGPRVTMDRLLETALPPMATIENNPTITKRLVA